MNTILKAIYDSNISNDVLYHRKDKAYLNAVYIRNHKLEFLKNVLNKSELEILEDYLASELEIQDMLLYDQFSYGFKLAMTLLMEVIQVKEELI